MKTKNYTTKLLLILMMGIFINPITGTTQIKRASRANKAEFLKGTIVIKVKEGIGPFEKQDRSVDFDIPSLDGKVQQFAVSKLEKRFRHKPIQRSSGLPDLSRIYRIEFPESQNIDQVVKEFAKDPNVEYAEPIPVQHSAMIPNDALYGDMYHLPQIFAEEAWDIHIAENGTEEIVIAVVDDGVDWDHEDLQDNIWNNLAEDADGDGHTMEFNGTDWVMDPGDLNGIDDDGNGFIDDLFGWNFYNNNGDPNPNPGSNHGTAVSGVSNAVSDNGIGVSGVGWNLSLMPVQVENNDGSYTYAYDGIIYAAENGADVISNSYGSGTYSLANQEAVSYAAGLGSIIVAAASNDNSSSISYPAGYQGVISCGAVNIDDEKASYSNYGISVDISAPGGDVDMPMHSTDVDDGYLTGQGTSAATVVVSGCFGLLKSYHPDWTSEQLIAQVLGTADNIDALNPDYVGMLGTGRINALEMLTATNLTPFLKLGLEATNFVDENENDIIENGEIVTLSFDLKNWSQVYGSENTTVTLTTDDPDITILSGPVSVNVPIDSSFNVVDQFQIQIGTSTGFRFADFNLHFESDISILVGQDIGFEIIIEPAGIFVYEGVPNGDDYSGTFINNYFNDNGSLSSCRNYFPQSLNGFSSVFLSFGFWDSESTALDDYTADIIIDYLQSGGYVYLEGGDVFGWNQSNNTELHELFGLASSQDGTTNNINSLQGQDDALTHGMVFTGNSQTNNAWIDKYVPNANGIIAFVEENYGNVAIQNSILGGHKTFCFSYALADLDDGESPNTREELLERILNFFDLYTSIPTLTEPEVLNCKVFPNPMKSNTIFQYSLSEDSNITLEIFNATGLRVSQAINRPQTKGEHTFNWNAESLAAGVYYYSLKSNNQSYTGKIIITNY